MGEVSRERETNILAGAAAPMPSVTAIKMVAISSFNSDNAIPAHCTPGTPYTVEDAAVAGIHEKKGLGRRASADDAKAADAPANKAAAKPANKAEAKPANKRKRK
jgi:hypothetical protein